MPRHDKGPNRPRNHRNNALDRETQISKALSLILRHKAKDFGLSMDTRGFVNVDDLLSHTRLRSLQVSLPEIKSIVSSNAKQRFELIVLPADEASSVEDSALDRPGNYLIRASQGHTIKGLDAESLLTPILLTDADCPAEVVHGTNVATWPAIVASGGLKPMGRVHVHFATGLPEAKMKAKPQVEPEVKVEVNAENGDDPEPAKEEDGVSVVPGAPPVVSGMRASAGLLVWVDVRRASEGGVKWWRSRNGVVLTEGVLEEGEKEGCVSLEFVSRAVERRTGKVVWRSEWWEEGGEKGV